MGISDEELNFQRLLVRSRKLCRDDLAGNLPRLRKAIERLQLSFIQMQGDRTIDNDLIMQYGRDLQQLKIIIEAEGKKTTQEKLAAMDRIPKHFAIPTEGLRRRRAGAVYRADLRKQLLGGDIDESNKTVEEHELDQENLTKELLRLTTEMKRNFTVAGTIIRDDNEALSEMQSTTENNKANLARESKRLEHHAYKSCFDCMMILIVVLVVWSFIGMVLIMRVYNVCSSVWSNVLDVISLTLAFATSAVHEVYDRYVRLKYLVYELSLRAAILGLIRSAPPLVNVLKAEEEKPTVYYVDPAEAKKTSSATSLKSEKKSSPLRLTQNEHNETVKSEYAMG
ncbi:USE1-like protein [Aphelenchoides besseyi]|nr:USE1-like protein [Aphelenchoides besseyi]